MGCGEARLATSVGNTVHSFDLVSTVATTGLKNIKQQPVTVTACDIAHVPLPDKVGLASACVQCVYYSVSVCV